MTMKIVLLLLLLVPSLSTPSFAQQCVSDVVTSVGKNSDKGTTYIMKSGAVYRELPVEADEYDSPFAPWIDSGD